jgi:hypothetical protein
MKRSRGGFRGGAKDEFGSAIDVNPSRCPFSMKAFRLTEHTRKMNSSKNVQPEGVRPVHHRKHGGNESSNCTFERSCHSRLSVRLLERPQGGTFKRAVKSTTGNRSGCSQVEHRNGAFRQRARTAPTSRTSRARALGTRLRGLPYAPSARCAGRSLPPAYAAPLLARLLYHRRHASPPRPLHRGESCRLCALIDETPLQGSCQSHEGRWQRGSDAC